MTRTFAAHAVDVTEMMDGDIVQILFACGLEEARLCDGESPYVSISVNYEFDDVPRLEWHHGSDGDGGLAVATLVLYRDRVVVQAACGTQLDIDLCLSDEQFDATALILTRMLGHRIERITGDPEPSAAGNRGLRTRSKPSRSARGA